MWCMALAYVWRVRAVMPVHPFAKTRAIRLRHTVAYLKASVAVVTFPTFHFDRSEQKDAAAWKTSFKLKTFRVQSTNTVGKQRHPKQYIHR